jgi:uncharacterized protein
MITAIREQPPKPLPHLAGPLLPFWEGLRAREIRVQKCLQCDRLRFPASCYCADCHGSRYEWATIGQTGEIESFCIFHKSYLPGFTTSIPYAVIQVRLASGVQFFSSILGVANAAIRIGMRVRAVFEDVDERVTLLKFAPLEGVT